MLPYRVSQRAEDAGVTHVHVDLDKEPEVYALFRSDTHHDNPHCLRNEEMAHLGLAKRLNAGIFDFGDTFDCMQSTDDRRASKLGIRAEHARDDYLDALVSETVKDYRPYARQFAFLGRGNHETSVLKRCGVDLNNRLAEELREEGASCVVGKYQGYIHFHFRSRGTKAGGYKIRYTHGYGGGGPVTKDAIQFQRQLGFIEDADMFVSGRTHDKWNIKQRRERLCDDGKVRQRTVDGIKTGTYLDAFTCGMGWPVERGHPPRVPGGWIIRFFQTSTRDNGRQYWHRQIIDADDLGD